MVFITMDIGRVKTVCATVILATCLFAGGCGEPVGTGSRELAVSGELGPTIGSLTEVLSPESIAVEGYGLVGGLKGTGSAECPPQLRAYLTQYILRQLPEFKDVEIFINSHNTAVVRLEGSMPTIASKNQSFDVKVSALGGTQTTSLEGGWLYGAELKATGRFSVATKVLATVKGPVFIDTIGTSGTDKKVGHILAGGRVLDDYKVVLALRRPDYRTAAHIRNLLNGRWDGVARAAGPGQIELKVPAQYRNQKQRFVSIVKSTYLTETPEINSERIKTLVRHLAVSKDKYASEIALEAIGNESLSKLSALLNLSNEEVRLRAARCMLNLGSNRGLEALGEIATDQDSAYRVEALEAITTSARRNDAAEISRRLLRDKAFEMRLAAYEQLRKLDDISLTQMFIGRNFYLEQITRTAPAAIFVSRSGEPRIVLFGAPIYCRSNIFVESADGNITINAPAGQQYVSLIRKHPTRNIPIKLISTFELGDIIQTLCEEPLKKGEEGRPGLGVSYADMISLLKQMCDKGAAEAEFRAGPLPKIN
jgi:flagellar P-ring protein precursor FlgI